MPGPHVYLFGAPRIENNSSPIEIQRRKTLALLIYLLVSGQSHSRDKLAALFWQDTGQAGARANLRRDISRLKQALGEEVLLLEGSNVGWNPESEVWLDVREFQSRLRQAATHPHNGETLCSECADALERAVGLYTDDFLAGFSLSDSSEFDDWQFFQAEELRRGLSESLQSLVSWHISGQEYAKAIPHARRWLALDVLHEPAHQALMRLYAWSGEHTSALRQYEECARLLREKLKISPDPETYQLYEAIKLKQLPPPENARNSETALPPPPVMGFPNTIYSFIGREKEMASLVDMLRQPDIRLVTIVGLGGIGKTRLSVEAARCLLEESAAIVPDGGAFFSLACVDDPANLPYAIARDLRLSLDPQLDPIIGLAYALEKRRMLLVMDNFEQLVEGAPLLEQLLNRCPGLKVIVTSRVPLHLSFEWRMDLDGLSLPARDGPGGDNTEAVRLFMQSAAQVRPGFELTESTRPLVYKLCNGLAGMPLAIRLAASWMRVMTLDQIMDEVERGLDILTSQMRDLPDRQRSMNAVFESTWEMLSSEERRAFAALSVFRGGFTADAASKVAEVSPYVLAGLVDHGLVRFMSDLRYEVHELTRQFAASKLKENEQAWKRVNERYSAYYLDMLVQASPVLYGQEPQKVMQALRTDAPNIRYSWDWAVRTLPLGDLQQFIQPLTDFFEIAGFLVMGEKAFHSAIQQHHDSAFNRTEMKALFKLWMHYMLFLVFEGQHIRAMEFLPRLEELGSSLGDPVSLGDMYHMQGIVYYYMDRKSEAMELFDQAVALYRPLDEPRRLVYALNFQGEGLSFMVRPRDALICHTEALEISQRTGERRMEALSLSHLGVAHYFLDQFDQAARCWAEAVEAFEQVGDVRDEGRTRNNLSLLYHRLGDYVRAVQYGEEAVALMAQVGDRIGEANSEETVGEAYFALGEYEKARECFEKSVEENQHLLRGVGDLASFHASLAEVDMAMGHYEEAERRLLLAEELDGERHPKEIARSLEITSRLYARTGRRDQALERIEKGIATLNQADDRLQASELLIRKASLLLDGGQIRAAGDALEQAMEILRQQNLPPLWFEAQLLKARITHAGGDKKGANQILRELHGFHRTKAQHADLHYTLWQLNHREEYARTAHEHYERLVQNTPDVEFQRRLQELGSALQKSSPAIR